MHPVLRPAGYGDDYVEGTFSADISLVAYESAAANDLEEYEDGTAVKLQCIFDLDVQEILALIEQEKAKYALLINAERTWHGELLYPKQNDTTIVTTYSAGAIAGKVSILPYIVSTTDIAGFQSNKWNPEFDGKSRDLLCGSVLAHGEQISFFVETGIEADVTSIFEQRCKADLVSGFWNIEIRRERIFIVMSKEDSMLFDRARKKVASSPNDAYLLNGIYLPALIASLNRIDENPDSYEDCIWYPSLVHRMAQVGCSELGAENSDRVKDAQRILERPYLRMPMINEEIQQL